MGTGGGARHGTSRRGGGARGSVGNEGRSHQWHHAFIFQVGTDGTLSCTPPLGCALPAFNSQPPIRHGQSCSPSQPLCQDRRAIVLSCPGEAAGRPAPPLFLCPPGPPPSSQPGSIPRFPTSFRLLPPVPLKNPDPEIPDLPPHRCAGSSDSIHVSRSCPAGETALYRGSWSPGASRMGRRA